MALSIEKAKLVSSELSTTLNPRKSRASAFGKVILLGEHAVVHGSRAVAIPLTSMSLEIVLEERNPSQQRKIFCTSENLHNILQDAMELLDVKFSPYKVEAHSKILFGAGMGASAALCVAMLRTLSKHFGKKLEVEELALLANRLEKRFHGTPSGLDAATVAYEKPLLFMKGSSPELIKVHHLLSDVDGRKWPWSFAVIDSGTRSPTLTMVQKSAPFFQGISGRQRVAQFDALALQVAEGLQTGSLSLVQHAMMQADLYLKEIGLVPPLLSNMIESALNSGVLAAKITGAGGGGCLLCLLDPSRVQETLDALREKFGAAQVYEVSIIGS